MYSTCIFCNIGLGANESVEAFPVGRRLAFDAAQGRLWVVCRGCGQWNLTPLEERWEAIEQCNRLFTDTRLRVSTEHIGLARLGDGLELVRIGRPMRPELAAWRYGDRFAKRRKKALITAGAGLAGAAFFFGGGAVSGSIVSVWILWQLGKRAVSGSPKQVVAHIAAGEGPVPIRRGALERVQLLPESQDQWSLVVPTSPATDIRLYGEAALHALGQLLPPMNRYGGSRGQVQQAVRELERDLQPQRYVQRIAATRAPVNDLPPTVQLALEMAAHEEAERRALEGELAALERAWRYAEEIASISDSLLLPRGVTDRLRRLRQPRRPRG